MPRKENAIGVYIIVNIVTKQFYVGSTFAQGGIRGRLNGHFTLLRNNKHRSNKILQNSFNKYGEENFFGLPLEFVYDKRDARKREKYWVGLLDPFFNINEVGDGEGLYTDELKEKLGAPFRRRNAASKGQPISEKRRAQLESARKSYRKQGVSEETKRKLSKSLKGKPLSEETKSKISEARKGKKLSEEHKQAISEGLSNREITPELKEKLATMKGKNHTDETKQKMSENNAKPWKGKTLSSEHRQAIADGVKRRLEQNPEIRQKISEKSKLPRKKRNQDTNQSP